MSPAEAVLEEMCQEMSLPWCPANAWWQVGHVRWPLALGAAEWLGIKSGNGTFWSWGMFCLFGVEAIGTEPSLLLSEQLLQCCPPVREGTGRLRSSCEC